MISQETWEKVIEEIAEMTIIEGRYINFREAVEYVERMIKETSDKKEKEELAELLNTSDFYKSYHSSIANSVIYILTNKGYDIEWQKEPKHEDDFEYWYAFRLKRRFGYV